MRKLLPLMLVLLLCSPVPPVMAEPTDEEVQTAFTLSFQAYFEGAMLFAFGQAPAGINVEGKDIIFDNFDLTTLKNKRLGTYKTISGRIAARDKERKADLTLTGGPVHQLKWFIEDYSPGKKKQVVQIEADGKTFVHQAK